MEIISDIISNKDIIEKIILEQGHCAEHYYYCFLYNIEPWEKGYCFKWDDKAILAKHDTRANEWFVFVGILAPVDEQIKLLKEFLDYAFSNNAKKVWCEFKTDFRKKVINALKDSNHKVNKINYTLVWPVFDMKQWNGDKMEGKDWKDIRYYWNKFFKEHKVEFVDLKDVTKEELKDLVKKWKESRNNKDKTFDHYYINVIDNDFKGFDSRIMRVDEKICSINAGFKLPGKNIFYSSIGLCTKDFDRLGEVSYMDDLIQLKKKGYELVDFGGGEKHLIEFKKKFRPTYYYKTHVFSIVKA
ncbi:TPA: DUF2156 domain-containing protein [Candidatus Woesearchaeota archaeon]|nr:DUF2156 domain-containing protein [Candidatus Woesearchaeota archaeon]HIH31391.1 DUF2156 domain-containing protein [Candidatus Woesearchaeota archaeon]HIH54404.1 DUF2156 domain-containing protein [Candidatus Woesearchaeota archaeon]HIJ01074.1 DUF2156 domain-containing protein [Candidatus Woesearchaeota archaeon]HIJ14124.1 DUF2156 domain-containing protein [Candidatus Woesearchaeota archaeon]